MPGVLELREASGLRRVHRSFFQEHGWGEFWKSVENITAFADWFDRYLQDTSHWCYITDRDRAAGYEGRPIERNY